jgi:hypothetical protein
VPCRFDLLVVFDVLCFFVGFESTPDASVSRNSAALIGNRWLRNRRSFPLDALNYLA